MGAFNDSRKERSVPLNAALPSLPFQGKKFLVECSNIFELKFFTRGCSLCAFCRPSAWLETMGSDLQKCQALTAAAVVIGRCTLNTLNPMMSLVLRSIRPQVCQIGSKINRCFLQAPKFNTSMPNLQRHAEEEEKKKSNILETFKYCGIECFIGKLIKENVSSGLGLSIAQCTKHLGYVFSNAMNASRDH